MTEEYMAKKTWISILLAVMIIGVIFVIAGIGGAVFFVRSHVQTQFVAADTATTEFEHARSRFAGQVPMIDVASDEALEASEGSHRRLEAVVRRDRVAPGPISALHVLAYDGRANKLVRADVPRWLLELGSVRGRLRLADLGVFEGERDRITLEDLDRRGPGLVLNVHRLRGTELLVWTD